MRLWKVSTGEEVGRFRGHSSPVTRVALAPPAAQAASASRGGTLHVWTTVARTSSFPYPSTGYPDAPAERSFPSGCSGPGAMPEERLSWLVALLPHMEQDNLARQFDSAKGYAGNLPTAHTRIKTFLCPAAKEAESAEPVTHKGVVHARRRYEQHRR